MKPLTPIRLTAGLATLMLAQSVWAVGTEAGVEVKNTAVLSYTVSGAPQTPIKSDESKFLVDRKVDLTVTGNSGSNYIVAPKSTGNNTGIVGDPNNVNMMGYKLSNEGNSSQAFKITVSHLTGEVNAAAADFDAETCKVQVVGTTPASSAAEVAIATPPTVTLAEDEVVDILVVCNMPDLIPAAGGLVNDGSLSTLEVLATAVDSSGDPMAESPTEDEMTIDVVLADEEGGAADVGFDNNDAFNSGDFSGGKRNASHSDTQTYEIDAPELSVVKTSAVITDPFNCTQSNDATDVTATACTGTPKRIPGAVIEYTMTISNKSDAAATGVTLTDIIDTNQDSSITGNTVEFVAGSISVDGVGVTDAADADSGEYDAAAETVTAAGLTIPAESGGTDGVTTVKFRVKID